MRSFKAGDRFVRVYDHTKAFNGSGVRLYNPTDFNSTLVKDQPRVRGRFSARKHKDPTEWFSYLYLGELRIDERTALLECVDVLSLARSLDNAHRVLDISSVAHLSLVYASLRRSITLLDITSQPKADVFQAELAVLQGDNHRLTRRWARYFRQVAPYVDGLCYTPKKYGSAEDGANVVLFGPHGGHGDMMDDRFVEAPLSSPAGIGRLLSLSGVTNIAPNV